MSGRAVMLCIVRLPFILGIRLITSNALSMSIFPVPYILPVDSKDHCQSESNGGGENSVLAIIFSVSQCMFRNGVSILKNCVIASAKGVNEDLLAPAIYRAFSKG